MDNEIEFKDLVVWSTTPNKPEATAYYPCVRKDPKYGKLLLSFRSANNGANTPAWRLQSILYGSQWSGPVESTLAVDAGAGWVLTDMAPVLDKLRQEYPEDSFTISK
jgi:hypothetical protein